MVNGVLAAVIALFAQALIYTGIAFVNAQLFPGLLAPVYEATGATSRIVVMTMTAALAANFLMPVPYQLTAPGLAGMLILVTLVIVLVAKALLLGEGQITWQVVAATTALIVSAGWVVHALNVASSG